MNTVARIDACPECQPGIPSAAPALSAEETSDGTLTAHQCGTCGTAWSALWREGWVIDRLTAPVALSGQDRERGAA